MNVLNQRLEAGCHAFVASVGLVVSPEDTRATKACRPPTGFDYLQWVRCPEACFRGQREVSPGPSKSKPRKHGTQVNSVCAKQAERAKKQRPPRAPKRLRGTSVSVEDAAPLRGPAPA